MNDGDDSSSGYGNEDNYLTISALVSSASAVVAVAASGQWARIAQLVVIAAQLATDLRRQRHTRRTDGNACPALRPPVTVPKLPGDHMPDWIAIPPECQRSGRYLGREGPCPSRSRARSRA
jgi:hypothetical protein